MCQIRNRQTLICKSFSNWEWIWRRSQHSCVTKTIDRLHRISKSCSVYKAIHFGRLTLQMFHFQFGFLWCLHSGTALIFGNQLRVKDRKIIWISVFTQKHIHTHDGGDWACQCDENHLLFCFISCCFFVRFSSEKRIRVTASLNFTSRTCAFTFHAHVNDNKYTGSDYRFLCNRHLFDDLRGNLPSQNVEFFSSFWTNDKWFMDYSFFSVYMFFGRFSFGSRTLNSERTEVNSDIKLVKVEDLLQTTVLHARLNCSSFFWLLLLLCILKFIFWHGS